MKVGECMNMYKSLEVADIEVIIELAWQKCNPFDEIQQQYGISKQQALYLMEQEMGTFLFQLWTKRNKNQLNDYASLQANELEASTY